MQIQDTTNIGASVRRARVPMQDFLLILVGAIVLLALIVATEWLPFLKPFRLLLGLAYVLYVPGYCAMLALFTGAQDLEGVERVGLSIGLSIAIIPLLVLLLDWLPWGIHLWSIVIGVYSVILGCSAIALLRRFLAPTTTYAPTITWAPRAGWRGMGSSEQRIYLLLAGCFLFVSLAAAWIFLAPAPDEYLTEFYMLGQTGMAEDYPGRATVGEELSVSMTIMNREREAHTYRVEGWAVDNEDPSKRERVAQTDAITLEPGQMKQWPLTWRMPQVGDDHRVEFLLFSDDSVEPYRQLKLWLNVVPQ